MDFKKYAIRTFYPSIPNQIQTTTAYDSINTTDGQGNTILAEKLLDEYLSVTLPSASVENWKSNAAQNIQNDLEYLNRKLSVARKTITSWDTYKVSEVVTDTELLGAKIQGLSLNSSLVVNTPVSVTLAGKTYSTGDIVFKDINGAIHLLKSQPTGYFFPDRLQQVTINEVTNTLQLVFAYAAGSPSETEKIVDTGNVLVSESLPYNWKTEQEIKKGQSIQIKYQTYTNDEGNLIGIHPKIFAYLVSDDIKGEEIYIDQDDLWQVEGSGDDAKINIQNNTDFDGIYIIVR